MLGVAFSSAKAKTLTADTEVGLTLQGREVADVGGGVSLTDRILGSGLKRKIIMSLQMGGKTPSEIAQDIDSDTSAVKNCIIKKMKGLISWTVVA